MATQQFPGDYPRSRAGLSRWFAVLAVLLSGLVLGTPAEAQLQGNRATVTVESGGSVFVEPPSPNNPFTCGSGSTCVVDDFLDGTGFFTAQPEPGFAFDRWIVSSGGSLTSPTDDFYPSTSRSVSAAELNSRQPSYR